MSHSDSGAVLDFLLRQSLQNTDALAFIGPTVGGAALGMMLPFTRATELHLIGLHAAGLITFDRQNSRKPNKTKSINEAYQRLGIPADSTVKTP